MSEGKLPIQWFPGHMAKSRRLLLEQLKRVDLVLELCDARIPEASRNPELRKMLSSKKSILLLNKADLADPDTTEKWVQTLRRGGTETIALNALKSSGKTAMEAMRKATRELVERYESRGIHKTVRAMIAGVPNVGKSTLINQLHGSRIAQTGDRPGVTRSSQWVKITPYLELLDTPGLLWPKMDDQEAARKLAYIGTISDDIMDLNDLAYHLLLDLTALVPDRVAERFHVTAPQSLDGIELMDAVCRGRGWIMKGGSCDYDRCSRIVLDEFRAGRLGSISLEAPAAEEWNDDGRQESTCGSNDAF